MGAEPSELQKVAAHAGTAEVEVLKQLEMQARIAKIIQITKAQSCMGVMGKILGLVNETHHRRSLRGRCGMRDSVKEIVVQQSGKRLRIEI